jgi:hypothetical protein
MRAEMDALRARIVEERKEMRNLLVAMVLASGEVVRVLDSLLVRAQEYNLHVVHDGNGIILGVGKT